jgi:hypothetical protein
MNRRDESAGNHRAAWDAIAWVVNGRATPAQARLVNEHAQHCADCRSELQRQRALHDAVAAAAPPALDVEAGLGRLFERIDAADGDSAGAGQTVPRPAASTRAIGATRLTHWLLAAVIIEAVGLSALGLSLLARTNAPDDYRVLTNASTAAGGATIRIVPAPSMRLDDLQQQLQALNLQIVSGPNAAGAYGLAPQSLQPSKELQLLKLRAVPGMRLVEPLNAEGPSR